MMMDMGSDAAWGSTERIMGNWNTEEWVCKRDCMHVCVCVRVCVSVTHVDHSLLGLDHVRDHPVCDD